MIVLKNGLRKRLSGLSVNET